MAPVLFNIVLEYIIRKLSVDDKGTIISRIAQIVAYADDVNIMARLLDRAKEILIDLDKSAKEVGVCINEDKTKTMSQTRRKTPRRQNATIGDYNFEKVEKFTYLKSEITNNANEMEEVKKRIYQANKTYFAVLPIIKSRQVHRKTKIHIYKTLVRPVLSYGSETWALTQTLENMLNTFERNVLRRILDLVQDGDVWRNHYNDELYSIYKEPEIGTAIRLRRL